jgi:hypothetical protein
MNDTKSKYWVVDGHQVDEYLKRRFISVTITFVTATAIILAMLAFIFYKQAPKGLWSFLFSVPLIAGAFLLGVKRWHNKLRKLADTEFILTVDSIVQTTQNQIERHFKFSEIAVVNKMKFGTTIVKGNWLTVINYYRPKRTPYQPDDPTLIFIPSITTNYAELIQTIKQARRLR